MFMARGVVIPDRALAKQAWRIAVGVEPSEKPDGVMLAEAELVRGVTAHELTGTDPTSQTEGGSVAPMEPIDVTSARRNELHSKPLVPVVRPARSIRSPHLVDDASVTIEKATNKMAEMGVWNVLPSPVIAKRCAEGRRRVHRTA